MKRRILKAFAIAVLTATLMVASTQKAEAKYSIWQAIWDVWFNPNSDWTTSP